MARPVRLPRAAEQAVARRIGTVHRDPKARRVRLPQVDYAAGLDAQCNVLRLPPSVPEFCFHPTRKWRYDRAWPAQRVAVEIDGGAWLPGGGHSHGRGWNFEGDRVKDAEALVRVWCVLCVTGRRSSAGTIILACGVGGQVRF
jgi:hypothetical protein